MHIKKIVLALVLILPACTEPDGQPGKGISHQGALNKSDIGTAVGAIGGTVIGWQFGSGAGQVLGAVSGGVVGGLLGDAVGTSLDEEDIANYKKACRHAMDKGIITEWKSTRSGHSGAISPGTPYAGEAGQECREYHQSIVIDGKLSEGRGTACLEPDGSWHLQVK